VALLPQLPATQAWLRTTRCVMLVLMKAPTANADTVRDYMRDVDRTLLRQNLKLTPEQRLAKFASFMRFTAELRRAGENVRRNVKLKR
jgi:hypothetical protein